MSFNCVLCDRSFDTQRGLNIHSKRSHRIDNTPELSITAETIDTVESMPSISTTDSQDDTINQCAENTFIWGEQSSVQFTRDLNFVYDKVVYWRKNLFRLPSGSAGKDFIREVTRLIKAWTSKSALRPIAWKCVMVMPQLLLQKPSKQSKANKCKYQQTSKNLVKKKSSLFLIAFN